MVVKAVKRYSHVCFGLEVKSDELFRSICLAWVKICYCYTCIPIRRAISYVFQEKSEVKNEKIRYICFGASGLERDDDQCICNLSLSWRSVFIPVLFRCSSESLRYVRGVSVT